MRPVTLAAACALALALALPACDTGSGDAAPSDQADTSAPPADTAAPPDGAVAPDGTPVDPGPLPVAPDDEAFVKSYEAVLARAETLTLPDFMAAYAPAVPPKTSALSYDPTASTYFEAVSSALSLTPGEVARIEEHGFMVSERLAWPTFGEALLEVYAQDLPILVTADMVLQALHSSYDDLLKTLEKSVLAPTLGELLADAHAALPGLSVGASALAQEALADADLFLAVARSLLAGQAVGAVTDPGLDEEVQRFLDRIGGLQMQDVVIFGSPRKMDFSQFEPRGHYEGDPALERYFRAMMWLGRVDLRFMELDPFEGTWVFHDRQLVAAHVLRAAVDAADGMPLWHRANDLITLMVGPVDYIDLRGVAQMAEDQGWQGVADVAGLDEATRTLLAQHLLRGDYGEQQINSHWLETNPFSAEPTPLPPSFALLGQRFVVDSYVFANVVYDTIVHEGTKVTRVLPDPLDALFVLGQDQALPHLEAGLAQYPYQGNLDSLRFLVDWYPESFWEDNLYNLWLQAVRALNEPTTADTFPEPMRTAAWRDRILNTQLGSWAQLRHDTLLYAKQSYTGGVACEHPDGFVEPYPALFGALKHFADRASNVLMNVPFEDAWTKTRVETLFASWGDSMARLEAMATKSLQGEAYTEDEIAFLKQTIMADPGCGSPVYSGWYKDLYFGGGDAVGEWKPTIADVHTNPNTGPLPGPNVLHVGTGNVNLMVLTAETCEGPEAYVGPVFSYYEVDVPEIRRLKDSEWEEMLIQGTQPARPAWTQSFLVSE